jgi:hypothetical protein
MTHLLRSVSVTSFAESTLQIRFILPRNQLTASWRAMLGRLASLFTIFVLLFGTVILPSIAHAHAPDHVEESFVSHEHEAPINSNGTSDDGEQPSHTVAHHHCSFAIGVDANHIKELPVYQGNKTRIVSSTAMPSWSQAPPTQPPSA